MCRFLAGSNTETGKSLCCSFLHCYLQDIGTFRPACLKALDKLVQRLFFSTCGNFHNAADITHKTADCACFRQACDKRTISHALDNAGNCNQKGHFVLPAAPGGMLCNLARFMVFQHRVWNLLSLHRRGQQPEQVLQMLWEQLQELPWYAYPCRQAVLPFSAWSCISSGRR